MSLIRKAFTAAFAAPLVMALAHGAQAETIFGAMAKAYQNNPDLNAARAGLRATDEGVTIAKSGYRPKLNAQVNLSVTRTDGQLSSSTSSAANELQSGLTLTQTIFDGFQTLNNVRAAVSNVFVSREQLRATEISILQAAAQAYVDVGRDRQIVQIRRQNLEFLREQLKAANARLQVGEGTRTDVSQAQAQLAAAQALLASAIAQAKASEAVYVQIVGAPPKGISFPVPASRLTPKDLSQALSTGRAENPDILSAQYSVDAQGYNVKSAEGALLPGVNVQGSLARSDIHIPGEAGSTDYNSASVSASITVPLYEGGSVTGKVRQAKELYGQAQIKVDSARRQVDQNIVSTWSQLAAYKENVSANQAQVRAAKLALDGVIEERKVGQRTELDVLDSQQTVLNARESLVQAQANTTVSSYTLLAYMGRLTLGNLGLKAKRYDPKVHYDAVKDRWWGLRTVDGR